MNPETTLTADYVRLGLRFGRLVAGFVDAYLGDPALSAQVANEPAPDPAELARTATELARAVPDSGLPADRAAFLTAHLDALAVSGARLAGAPMTLVEEVQGCFDVAIELTDTEVYAQAHAELAGLIGGRVGAVGENLAALRATERCPPELVETAVRRLAAALRGLVVPLTGLSAGEHIDFEVQRDVAWSGFNYYLGGFASRVAVNADVGHRMSQLPVLVAHECYPGHHTEHCRKEDLLLDRGGQVEQSIFLVNTPQCVMAEGLGDLALSAILGDDWARWAADVLDGLGPAFDVELAPALERAARPLNSVRQNAALMRHDHGAGSDEVLAYLQRWGLVDERRARQQLRFLADPLWRAYTTTYVEGERLLRPWLEARPAQTPAMSRFARLLDEPLTPAAIRTELADNVSHLVHNR